MSGPIVGRLVSELGARQGHETKVSKSAPHNGRLCFVNVYAAFGLGSIKLKGFSLSL
jgi:hypothetical protein